MDPLTDLSKKVSKAVVNMKYTGCVLLVHIARTASSPLCLIVLQP